MKKLSFTAAKKSPEYIKVSDGNKKLQPSKNLKYIIFSIPAIKTCPYATEMCKKLCYAIKAEKAYPSCKKAREYNYSATLNDDFVARMIFTINANLDRPGYKAAKKVVVRIHESGDFYSKDYFEKWVAIAEHFKSEKKVVFMAYTKSVNFVHDIPENMVVRFSLWDDTDPKQYEKAVAMGMPVYTAVEKFTSEPKKIVVVVKIVQLAVNVGH